MAGPGGVADHSLRTAGRRSHEDGGDVDHPHTRQGAACACRRRGFVWNFGQHGEIGIEVPLIDSRLDSAPLHQPSRFSGLTDGLHRVTARSSCATCIHEAVSPKRRHTSYAPKRTEYRHPLSSRAGSINRLTGRSLNSQAVGEGRQALSPEVAGPTRARSTPALRAGRCRLWNRLRVSSGPE